jgi:hypothetical protein
MDPCRQVLGKVAQVDFQRTGLECGPSEFPVNDHRCGLSICVLLGGYRARMSTRVVRLHCSRLENHFELVR